MCACQHGLPVTVGNDAHHAGWAHSGGIKAQGGYLVNDRLTGAFFFHRHFGMAVKVSTQVFLPFVNIGVPAGVARMPAKASECIICLIAERSNVSGAGARSRRRGIDTMGPTF